MKAYVRVSRQFDAGRPEATSGGFALARFASLAWSEQGGSGCELTVEMQLYLLQESLRGKSNSCGNSSTELD